MIYLKLSEKMNYTKFDKDLSLKNNYNMIFYFKIQHIGKQRFVVSDLWIKVNGQVSYSTYVGNFFSILQIEYTIKNWF